VPALRLGLLGGTFDPPHVGHLVVAQDALERLNLDRLHFVVAGSPPHKVGEPVSSAPIRLEMTRAAVEGNPSFEVSEVELDRDGPSFTVDTLHHYRKHLPDATLFLLLGMDQVVEFQDWERPDEIQTMATLVALSRGGSDRTSQGFPANQDGSRFRFQYLDVTRIDVSATEIRRRVGAGRSIRYLVPENVESIIEGHRLYRPIS